MKNLKYLFGVVSVGVVFGLMASSAQAGTIVGSKHDILGDPDGVSTGVARTATNDNGEICIFCHTPHTTSTVEAPLWNRQADTNTITTYTMYSSSTKEMVQTGTGPQGVSLGCLSCHDGATALDSMIKNPNLIALTTGTTMAAGTAVIGSGGDLTDDHPISLTYNPAADQQGGTAAFAAISTGKVGGLPLYGASQNQVECASCHNPHDPANTPFLRKANTNSDLCRSCHTK